MAKKPKPPYRIWHKHWFFDASKRGTLHERAKVEPREGVSWSGGARVCRVVMDDGWTGWTPAGPVKRLERIDAYERLYNAPMDVLNAAAAEGDLALARAVGQAIGFDQYSYSNHPEVTGGGTIPLEAGAIRMFAALRNAPRLDSARAMAGWLRRLNANNSIWRHGEKVPDDDCYLLPTDKWSRNRLPLDWNVDMARVALWGGLVMLLLEGDGVVLDAEARADIASLADEMAATSYNMGSRFEGAGLLTRYREHDRLRFTTSWRYSAPRGVDSGQLGLEPGMTVLG